jgi:hypothetical protein
MFDLLINAEVIVEDVALAHRVFVEALGFPPQRSTWGNTEPGNGFTYLFARVHPSLSVSPTRIEAMAVAPIDESADPAAVLDFLPALLAAQGSRPWKTHGNELATSDIHGVADRLRENGCPFFTLPATESNPFTRLWLGWTDQARGAYQPSVDGGLMFEICETGALLQGPRLWDLGSDPDLPPGSMIRVLRRSWIVRDLDQTLSALEQNLGWATAGEPALDGATGCRRAVMGFHHSRSAELELLEPVGAGAVAASLEAFGPGAWVIRIGVNDVRAKAADLRKRGTAFDWEDEGGTAPVLGVDTGSLGVPGLFQFAEATST